VTVQAIYLGMVIAAFGAFSVTLLATSIWVKGKR
jgi:hypothetical protein